MQSVITARGTEMSAFAQTIYEQKYAWKDENGLETWDDTALRVTRNVLGALGYTEEDDEFQKTRQFIAERKFLPGGRYLYASGRPLHQVNNCLLLKAEDSREGWADLLSKSAMALQTGAGIGVDYSDIRPSGSPIRRTGGVASGPLALMQMVNEIGRGVMQGGSRRSAIWAGLKWNHMDVFDFISFKDWPDELRTIKEKDFNFPAPMEFTNISVLLDDEFFDAHDNPTHEDHDWAMRVYDAVVGRMVKTAEPGLSVDTGNNVKETLRNAPVVGDTRVLTQDGYRKVINLVNKSTSVWTGMRWAEDVVFKQTGSKVPTLSIQMTGGRKIQCDPSHEFLIENWIGRGEHKQFDAIRRVKAKDLSVGDRLHVSLPYSSEPNQVDNEAYTLGFLYGDGSFHKSGGADLTLCTEESKNCSSMLVGASSINEHDSRGFTRMYFPVDDRWKGRTKGELGLDIFQMQDDSLRSFIAGLFDSDGNWEPTQRRIRLASKSEKFLRDVARGLEQLGILAHVSKGGTSTYGKAQTYQLVIASEYRQDFADDIPTQRIKPSLEGYESYRPSAVKVTAIEDAAKADVFCADVGVAEHSFQAEGVIISNCTEVTSEDDSDICNLGSINMARVESLEEMAEVVRHGILFLLAGTVYSHVPYERVSEIREKNRRLGLGLMGVHEWLLKRGYRYEPCEELGEWLETYADSTDVARTFADKHGLSHPVKTRAIAPCGTIGIIGETTTGIEPIFCVAFKRRYLNGGDWKFQYVVDPTARRLIDEFDVDPIDIEDAYMLSYNVERRIAFQAWVQGYVDHGISSTINLPYAVEDAAEVESFKKTLYPYLHRLRGVTVYPDGARGGQPLTVASYEEAMEHEGVIFEEDPASSCSNGVCGS